MSLKTIILNSKNTHVKVESLDGYSVRTYSGFLDKRVVPYTITKQVFGLAKNLQGNITRVTITYTH